MGSTYYGEVRQMKKEEVKPSGWEVSDPKLPVVRSGHMENRRCNIKNDS
jgi:hypothetical protein